MGRKPLSDIAKESQLRILLTSKEREELDTAATAAGVPTSTWARDLLLAAARAGTNNQTAAESAGASKPAKKAKDRKQSGA